ncbi:helix-turn-helix transcriptional regulator [Caldalkalibacillus salinus]|uniref:helix-turn-helix transcriptional regulator n=1 Tax=Caldalkalibacillus salinus TaxID=2803787 RepID=UPI001925063E|nr:helix-turn-helix transcriptional regulator [Caldalkalibacillus salinus]
MRTKLIRLRGKRTKTKVAQDLNITPQMYGAIERGDRDPSLRLASKIARYFHVSVDHLFVDGEPHDTGKKSAVT